MNTLPSFCKVIATDSSGAATVEFSSTEVKYGDGYSRIFKTSKVNDIDYKVEATLAPLTSTQWTSLQSFLSSNLVFNWVSPLYNATQWSCKTVSAKGVRNVVNVTLTLQVQYGVYL